MNEREWRNFWANYAQIVGDTEGLMALMAPDEAHQKSVHHQELMRDVNKIQRGGLIMGLKHKPAGYGRVIALLALRDGVFANEGHLCVRAGDVVVLSTRDPDHGSIVTQAPVKGLARVTSLIAKECSAHVLGVFIPVYTEAHLFACLDARRHKDKDLQHAEVLRATAGVG